MVDLQRRTTMFMGFAAVTTATATAFSLPALADEDLVVPYKYNQIKRGEIHSLDPATRGVVMIWPDLGGRVKLKASSMVVKTTSSGAGLPSNAYSELKEGQTVDVNWFDYLDFLVAKTTPEVTARAKAMVASGARIEGIPGTAHDVRTFSMAGMVTSTDPSTGTLNIINASGGEPDKPSPDSGEIIRLPQIKSEAGLASLRALKPGDLVTTVYSVQTALRIQIIR